MTPKWLRSCSHSNNSHQHNSLFTQLLDELQFAVTAAPGLASTAIKQEWGVGGGAPRQVSPPLDNRTWHCKQAPVISAHGHEAATLWLASQPHCDLLASYFIHFCRFAMRQLCFATAVCWVWKRKSNKKWRVKKKCVWGVMVQDSTAALTAAHTGDSWSCSGSLWSLMTGGSSLVGSEQNALMQLSLSSHCCWFQWHQHDCRQVTLFYICFLFCFVILAKYTVTS